MRTSGVFNCPNCRGEETEANTWEAWCNDCDWRVTDQSDPELFSQARAAELDRRDQAEKRMFGVEDLRAAREALGLSQEDFGQALAQPVKQSAIAHWESGKRLIPLGVQAETEELEDQQEELVGRIVDLAVSRSAKLNDPVVVWDVPFTGGAPRGMMIRALAMAARELRYEHEITLRIRV